MSKEKFGRKMFSRKAFFFRPGPLASKLKSARLAARKLWIKKGGEVFWLSVAFGIALCAVLWTKGVSEYRAEVRAATAAAERRA